MTPCEHPGAGFESRLAPSADNPRRPALWFIFQGDRMLITPGDEHAGAPQTDTIEALGLLPLRTLYLGCLAGEDGTADCYAAEIAPDAVLPAGMIAEELRGVYPLVTESVYSVAGRAVQLLAWDRTNRFCGQCGGPTADEPHERAKRCPACGLVTYPRLSPAIIVAVVREVEGRRELLMARNHRFPPGRYSVLAGYVEPGETLEECAHREVCEEVGISMRNLRYFASQPWPFPNSLMIAFTAEYAGGDIRLEESEIADAAWFAAGALPGLPPKMSVARRLIDWFVANPPG